MKLKGTTGKIGPQGPVGERGDHGQQGPRGLPGKTAVTKLQAAALALFVLFCFLLLAWRSEQNADRIDESQREIIAAQRELDQTQRKITENTKQVELSQYTSCVNGVKIIVSFNRQLEELAELERTNQFIDQELRDKRIATYRRGIAPVPVCRR